VTGVMWGGLGCGLCGVQRVWYVCAVWYDIAQCGIVIAQELRIIKRSLQICTTTVSSSRTLKRVR
jgi:hypothetical protein